MPRVLRGAVALVLVAGCIPEAPLPSGVHPAAGADSGVSHDATVTDVAVDAGFDSFRVPDVVSPDAIGSDGPFGDAPAGGGDGSECTTPATLCAGECVDVQTDPNHCGACGIVCVGQCALGRCLVTLASDQDLPVGLAVTPSFLYWTNQGSSGANSGSVMVVPLAGITDGGVRQVIGARQASPYGVVVAGGSLYWTDEGSGAVLAAQLLAGGGSTTDAAVVASTQAFPSAMATASGELFWVDTAAADAGGAVMGLPLTDGGVPSALATSQSEPTAITAVDGGVYWATTTGIAGVLLAFGGTPDVLATGAPTAITADATHLYWANRGTAAAGYADGTVLAVERGGGAVSTLATGQYVGTGIAVDASAVYWTTTATPTGGGNVMSLPLAGGVPTTIATAQQPRGAIVVDSTSVYWTSGNQGGSVVKATPK